MACVIGHPSEDNPRGNEIAMRKIVEENMPVEVEDGKWMFTEPRLALPRTLADVEYQVSIGDGTNRKPTLVRVNTKRSTFNGKQVTECDNWQRRKIENLFIVSYMREPMLVYFD